MQLTEITLIVIGVIFLIASFLVKDKLSSKDVEQIANLSEEELKIIVEKQLKNAEGKIEDTIDQAIADSQDDTKRLLEKNTNEKIMAINEYSDTVLESMNKTHNEIMFLYSMLNDKHKDLTDLANHLQEFSKQIENIEAEAKANLEAVSVSIAEEVVKAEPVEETEMLRTTVDSIENNQEILSDDNNSILRLHKQGLSDVEIAKSLGRGLGEVKLVIGLYKGDDVNEI